VHIPQPSINPRFTPSPAGSTLAFVRLPHILSALPVLFACLALPSQAQEPTKPSEKPAPPEAPAQIELLETHIRFEPNGESRKEVHTRVHINNELGVRQFARIGFNYNRSFEQIEIPQIHITHATGGTADILPSAITDQPDPAVASAPAYQDVRVKSLRILGLAPGDTLEYRVVTTISHHPLAPDFWLDHSFDRSGDVSQEIFELDLPVSHQAEVRINPATPVTSTEKSGEGDSARTLYRWQRSGSTASTESQASPKPSETPDPDVVVSNLAWEPLSIQLDEKLTPGAKPLAQMDTYEKSMQELLGKHGVTPEITAKALDLTKAAHTKAQKLEAIYDFVSQRIATVGLPLGATGFTPRLPTEILSSGYATPEDKFVLFAAMSSVVDLRARAALTGYCDSKGVPRPSVFSHLLVSAADGQTTFWLDPSLEVAPFGVISSPAKKCVFVLAREFSAMNSTGHEWQTVSPRFPFPSSQRVNVDATLAADGTLTSKVKYTIRGENELLLRVAFHQSPREKWKDVAQLLALSDGFRGNITSAKASDPYATKHAFTVEYEITQPKFVDWSKKPVRIPALLPTVGLPDPPEKPQSGRTPPAIELGTPLNVDTKLTLHLPPGVSAEGPTGTSVKRDYATFTSNYAAEGNVVFASRQINFLHRQIPAASATDYSAFLHAVQTDQTQLFTLTHLETVSQPQPPKPATPAPAKP
jgi:hypothetical protein